MEEISGEDFIKIIYSENADTISDLTILITKPLNIDLNEVNLKIAFSNIKFSGKTLQFYNFKKEDFHYFTFTSCIFNCNLIIESSFEDLSFISNIFNCDKFTISNSKISVLSFDKKNDLGQNEISENRNLLTKGILKIDNCTISNLSIDSFASQNNSEIKIEDCDFIDSTSIQNSILNKSHISNCRFYKDFEYSCDYNKTTFTNCDFFKSNKFKSQIITKSSTLFFEQCTFHEYLNFNEFILHKLILKLTLFKEITSFQDTQFDSIEIDRTTFTKTAWFDNSKIKNITNCDRRTIRTIKQELQKTDNKIDYNTYRNYELVLHYKELKFKENFKDTSILWATKWSSNFGNWFWALGFTLLSGLFWYLILYKIENPGIYNPEKINTFIIGIFRFFLVTDFYNPLENDRTYLENGWSWLIFILGKIFIAFGIYEMIQSFRKFKA